MSHPSRPRTSVPDQRRRRGVRLESLENLESRQLLAPVVNGATVTATYTPFAVQAKGQNLGTVTFTTALPSQTGATNALTAFPEAAAITSVSELTPTTSFGGDIVRIRTGPGGEFGNSIYAVSRGAGDNATKGAINRPGVIYRVDTATGKASVFFDLNTVIPQLDPTQTSAAGGLTATSGLTNWYDISFDPEGYFDGRPSMFISSADSANTAKNAIYRVAPDGTFLGAFTTFSDNTVNAAKLTFNPTAILIPPPEQQTFLRGLIAGTGSGSATNEGFFGGATDNLGNGIGTTFTGSTSAQFAALYFDSNQVRPGTPINSLALPNGVKQTALTLGPQVGLTAANNLYPSLVYDAFADFGIPAFGGLFNAQPGVSGVQGLGGELLINLGFDPNVNANTNNNPTPNIDLYPAATTPFRRFQDVAFDQYGFFSQGLPTTVTAGTTGATSTGSGSTGGGSGGGATGSTATTGTFGSPIFAGSLFVSDLATGLAVPITIPAPAVAGPTGTPAPSTVPILFPVQGPGEVGISNPLGGGPITITNTTGTGTGPSLFGPLLGINPSYEIGGGRILRIDPQGRATTFASGFNTSNAQDGTSFSGSSLSLSFSADGTTLYASDDDGIWQFKTTASLAGSSSGSIIGLNDLRTLGVPYDGRNSAVDVIDTGIDANNTSFRGRVATGTSTSLPGGNGKDDLAPGISGSGTTINGGGGNTTGNNGNNANGNTGGGVIALNADGHGTPVAGIIAQFVPQATLNPINVFEPFVALQAGNTTGGTNGGNNGNNNGAIGVQQSFNSNASATTDSLFAGFQYATNNPYVKDPIRPLNQDRVIAASLAFGTTETFATEQTAYKQYPQVVIAFKNQLDKFLKAGIAPIAASGQFGAPAGAIGGTTNGTNGNTGANGANGANGNTQNPGQGATNNAQNASVGDLNGMSLPAIFNEVISVTGSYPFIFQPDATTPPTDPASTVVSRQRGPILVFGSAFSTPGSTADSGATTTTTGTTTTGTGTAGTTGTGGNNLSQLTAAESTGGGAAGTTGATANAGVGITTFSDRLLGSANRNATTDFAAPALDAPTFRRTFIGDGGDPNIFLQGGTSVSSAIVTGSYALISSALQYWSDISKTGVTDSAYLTTPVGAHVLNYGPHVLFDPKAYNRPDGINSILAYSAVPAADINDNLTVAGPPNIQGTTVPRNYARISVSNAIATIEGKIGINYLIKHGTFNIIDANHDGLITSQEIQNFVDTAAATGQTEAGAMARLLGGTARSAINTSFTARAETPDQPDVLQRRFNFFDYAVHGKLQGSVSIAQFKLLNKYILPTPDAYSITDRQRASANGFLIAPQAQRNTRDLQRQLPGYTFVPKGAYVRYKGTTPAQFGVNTNLKAAANVSPVYTLFDGKAGAVSTGISTPPQGSATTTTAAAGGSVSGAATPTTSASAVTASSVTSASARSSVTDVTNPAAPTTASKPGTTASLAPAATGATSGSGGSTTGDATADPSLSKAVAILETAMSSNNVTVPLTTTLTPASDVPQGPGSTKGTSAKG